MNVDNDGEMTWPDLVSPRLPAQGPNFSECQPSKNTSITPVSTGFGSPNAMTPWTGKLQLLAAGNSSAIKETQTRRRQHKQKAKPSFFHTANQQDEELPPHQDTTNAFEQSSPVKASNQREEIPTFLSQHAALGSDFEEAELDHPSRFQKPLNFMPFGGNTDEPPMPTGSSEADLPDKPEQEKDNGPAMLDSLRDDGKLPVSSAAPSEDMPRGDSPPQKLWRVMRGLSAMAADLPPQKKQTTSLKPTKGIKSNTKVKMSALDLEDDNDIENATADPFDIGNIPSSFQPTQVSQKIVQKATIKTKAATRASKAKKKPAARQQKKAKESFIEVPSDNPEVFEISDVNGGDDEYIDNKSQPRITRKARKTRNTKAKPSATSQSLDSGSKAPNTVPVPKDDKTSNIRGKKKLRAPANKAVKTAPGKPFEETTREAAVKMRTIQMDPPFAAAPKKTAQAATTPKASIVSQSHSRDASEDMSTSPNAPVTGALRIRQAGQAERPKKADLTDTAANRLKIPHVDGNFQDARKPTIIHFGADGPEVNGRRRKNPKDPEKEAEIDDLGVHSKSDVQVVATEAKLKTASHGSDVHGRAEKDSRKEDMVVTQLSKTSSTLDNPTNYSEQASLYRMSVDSDTDAQASSKSLAAAHVDEDESDAMPQDLFVSPPEEEDALGARDYETSENDDLMALHGSPRPCGTEQDAVTYASPTSEESEKSFIVDGKKAKQETQNRHTAEQASVGQEIRHRSPRDSGKLFLGNIHKQTYTHADEDISPNHRSHQEDHESNTRTTREDRDQVYIRGHQKMKPPAPPAESGQATRLVNQRLQLPAHNQSLSGVRPQQMGAHEMQPASLVEGFSDRPMLRTVAYNADTMRPFRSSGETFYMPVNGRSSDDVFGPGKTEEQVEIDPAVLERLRGHTRGNRSSEKRTAELAGSVEQSTAARAGVRSMEDINPDQSLEKDALMAVGINTLKRRRLADNDRPQRKATGRAHERVMDQATEQVEIPDKAGNAMHRIVDVSLTLPLDII